MARRTVSAFNSANTAGNLIAVYVIWNNSGAVALSDSRSNTYAAATARIAWGSGWSAQVFYADEHRRRIEHGQRDVRYRDHLIRHHLRARVLRPQQGESCRRHAVRRRHVGSHEQWGRDDHERERPPLRPRCIEQRRHPSRERLYDAFDGLRQPHGGSRRHDAGSYAGTASQNGNAWVMQLVAFRADTGTADTTPPSVPTVLTATAVSTTQINLSWTASTDNVGVSGYKIFRNGTQVATCHHAGLPGHRSRQWRRRTRTR